MSGKYTIDMYEQFRREQDEKAAKAEEERLARTEKESARRAWLADGGKEADFEKAWPGHRDAARKQRVMDADRAGREEMRSGTTSRI
jgi:hypothetical protein